MRDVLVSEEVAESCDRVLSVGLGERSDILESQRTVRRFVPVRYLRWLCILRRLPGSKEALATVNTSDARHWQAFSQHSASPSRARLHPAHAFAQPRLGIIASKSSTTVKFLFSAIRCNLASGGENGSISLLIHIEKIERYIWGQYEGVLGRWTNGITIRCTPKLYIHA